MCIDNISRFYSVLTDDKEILIYGARKPDAAGNAAGEHNRAAAEAPRAKRRAAAGQNDEDHAAILLDEHIDRRKRDVQPHEIHEIKQEMDDNDA